MATSWGPIVLSESGNNVDVRFKSYPTGLSSGFTLGVTSMDGGKGRELGAVSLTSMDGGKGRELGAVSLIVF